MGKTAIAMAGMIALAVAAQAAEIHVAVDGKRCQSGDARPRRCRTIQRAAELARPGDIITVHAGVYRERIDPPRGGESDAKRITYQAAPGETVEIKGSEVVKNWVRVQPGVWKAVLPNSLFGAFNPYTDLIRGDWFEPKGRAHHTGAVYLDGEWLAEAATLEDVLKPAGATPLWFAQVDKDRTTIWAQFGGADPNDAPGRDQRPPDGVLSPKRPHRLHHGARLHHAARGHALGAADGRAGRAHRHELEQGLDHREERRQPFGLLGHRPRQARRRLRQHLGGHRRRLRQDDRARPGPGLEQGHHRRPRRP